MQSVAKGPKWAAKVLRSGWVAVWAVPFCLAACLFLWTVLRPVSAMRVDIAPAATPAGKTGTFVRRVVNWVLVQKGEVWLLRDDDWMLWNPAGGSVLSGRHEFHSPMQKTLGGGEFDQADAQKYWKVESGFGGFGLSWKRGYSTASVYRGSRAVVTFPLWILGVPLVLVLLKRLRGALRAKRDADPACGCGCEVHREGESCLALAGTPLRLVDGYDLVV